MFEGFRKILALFSERERRQLPWLFLAVVSMGLLEVAGIASVMPFLAIVTNPETIHTSNSLSRIFQTFGFTSTKSFLFATGGLVLCLLVVSNLMTGLTTWLLFRYSWMRNHSLSTRLLRNYLHQNYEYFLTRNTSEMSAQILGEVAQVTNGVITPGLNLVARAIVAVLILTLLFLVDPILTIIVAIVLGGAYGVIYLAVRSRLLSGGEERVRTNAARYKLASEAFGGIKDLQLLAREGTFVERYSEISLAYSRSQASGAVISTVPRYALETIAFGGILVCVLYLIAVNRDLAKVISVVGLYAFAAYRLLPALQQIFFGVATVRYHLAALDTLYQDITTTSAIIPRRHLADAAPLKLTREIALENISYRYSTSESPALSEISLTIKANSTVGFVGFTGSGKTTLVDIVLGLLQPQGGKVLIDGRELEEEQVRAWQQNLGYVSQHIYLSDSTIARNIAFAGPEETIDQAAIEQAARVANLHEFITRQLSDGYDTVIGERGIRLSGGERQRVGIARALYKNPSVLVLDEATSALDGVTERTVMQAIRALAHKKTIIMIAHRLATVQACDVLFVLERGRIVAQGNFDSLMRDSAQFREMAKVSYREIEAGATV